MHGGTTGEAAGAGILGVGSDREGNATSIEPNPIQRAHRKERAKVHFY